MGSGKTTLGKRLANKLEYSFIDLDAEIEKIENCSINEIFDDKGETYFRELESKILHDIISENRNIVLSVGGGTPCFNDNMKLINETGTSVYLKYNAGILCSRLLNAKTERPLIKGLDETQLKEFVANKLLEREAFYNQSKLVIERNNVRVEDVLNLLN